MENPELNPESKDNSKEWNILEKVVLESFTEQKRARRWGVFFKLLTFFYLFIALVLFVGSGSSLKGNAIKKTEPHTALVKLQGIILDEEEASANVVVTGLREAFENEHSKAIILAINSPGGSPVQSGYIYDEINRLREKYPDKKLYAVISDLGASGAYYVAAAADAIYADKASLVGSIGVISESFGFTEALEKLGVERRIIAAGENKAFLDPFQPLKQEEKVFWEASLEVVHKQFIDQVKKGRGDRLQDDPAIFSGLIWPGETALEKGLVDGLGSAGYVAREIVGEEDIVDYSRQPSPLHALISRFGASVGSSLAKSLRLESTYPLLK